MIESYEFGRMVVDGQPYTSDIIILPQRIISSWWRKEGHKLSLEDLEEFLGEELEVLVVGTGFFGLMKIDAAVRETARLQGWMLIVENTKKAVRDYNEMAAKIRTAGAFHLTC